MFLYLSFQAEKVFFKLNRSQREMEKVAILLVSVDWLNYYSGTIFIVSQVASTDSVPVRLNQC